MLLLLSLWRAAAAATGTVSKFTGAAILEQGEAESVVGTLSRFTGASALRQGEVATASGGLTSFSGAGALRQGEKFTAAAVVSKFIGAAIDEQGEVLVDVGFLTSFFGASAARQGEAAGVVGLASSFTGAAALQETAGAPSFAAAGVVSSLQGLAGVIATALAQRSAGVQPKKTPARPILVWVEGVPYAPLARPFNAVIAYGALSPFSGGAGATSGAQVSAAGGVSPFSGAAAANADLYLEEDELILLALAA